MSRSTGGGLGRGLGAASVVAVLVAVGVLVIGGSMAWAALTVSFYDVIQTDEWATPAPGPSGVTQYGSNMLIVDTDANNYWDEDTGVDVWEITPGGTVVSTWSTGFEAGVAEPTGINYDADNDRLFITNDDGEYYIFEPGDDGVFGNGDPTPQAHTVPGSGDAEDPVYDFATNRLYVLDGGGSIFALTPETGALVATIDLGALGPTNWEGLAMTPTGELLVGANVGRQIFVISTDGEPRRSFRTTSPRGKTSAPKSLLPSRDQSRSATTSCSLAISRRIVAA